MLTSFERRLCRRNPVLGEASEGAVAPEARLVAPEARLVAPEARLVAPEARLYVAPSD